MAEKKGPKLSYHDIPELQEVFADHLHQFTFDGNTLKLVFGVTRLDLLKQGQTMSGKQYPSCRLVLTPAAADSLLKQLTKLAQAVNLEAKAIDEASKATIQ